MEVPGTMGWHENRVVDHDAADIGVFVCLRVPVQAEFGNFSQLVRNAVGGARFSRPFSVLFAPKSSFPNRPTSRRPARIWTRSVPDLGAEWLYDFGCEHRIPFRRLLRAPLAHAPARRHAHKSSISEAGPSTVNPEPPHLPSRRFPPINRSPAVTAHQPGGVATKATPPQRRHGPLPGPDHHAGAPPSGHRPPVAPVLEYRTRTIQIKNESAPAQPARQPAPIINNAGTVQIHSDSNALLWYQSTARSIPIVYYHLYR